MSERKDMELIAELVPPGSRVLDLGCGNGELLALLRARRQCTGYGIEISDANVLSCTQRGVNVIQLNLEEGLALFEDQSFDVVLQLDTLQHLRNTEKMLFETARVGRIGVVSFPNFAHWRCRVQLFLTGKAPVTKQLPFEWHNSPNIHCLSLKDFERFCRRLSVKVEKKIPLIKTRLSPVKFAPNLFAEQVIYVTSKD